MASAPTRRPRSAATAETRAMRAPGTGAAYDPTTAMGGSGGRRGPKNISRLPYTPGLDGMRALAVVAVMVYHANHDWLPGGFLGVEVFFIISGYLITLLLISEHERSGRVNLGQFWLRRARRLLPALFLMLAMLVTYTAFFNRDALGQLRGDVVAGVFYVSNWFQIWIGAGYSAGADFAPLRHLWSLAVEEQFYLVWPLVMAALLARKGRRISDSARWMLLASLLVTVVVALLYHRGPVAPTENWESTPGAFWDVGGRPISKGDSLYLSTITRSTGLLLGAAFAMIWRPVAIMRSPLRHKGPLLDMVALVGVLGLAGLCWALQFMTVGGADPWLFRGGFLLTGITTLMVIAAATHARAKTGPLLGNRVFLWVGTRSYGLYLYHWPIYQIIREQAGIPLKFGEFAGAMAVTAVITELSYRFVEMPIRQGRASDWWNRMRSQRDPIPRRIVATAGAIGVAAASFATVNLATAKVEPNEVQQAIDRGDGAITDPFDEVEGSPSDPPTSDPQDDPTDSTVGETTSTAVTAPPATKAPSSGTGGNPNNGDNNPRNTTTSTTAAPSPSGSMWAIGDSVMMGASTSLDDYGFKVSAQVGYYVGNGIQVVQQIIANGDLGDVVVIHLGANGPISQDEMDELMELLADVPQVLLINIYTAGGYHFQYDVDPTNELIAETADQYDNVELLDWNAVAGGCEGNCFASDNLHLSEDGADYYAAEIANALDLN